MNIIEGIMRTVANKFRNKQLLENCPFNNILWTSVQQVTYSLGVILGIVALTYAKNEYPFLHK
jgi:hypothetical protein